MLRGVNCRGVGVGGSAMVHGYRMCLGGYAAWLPSVRMSHSALLSRFLTFSISLSIFLHIFSLSLILLSSNPLSCFLSFFSSFLIFRVHGHCCKHEVISSLKKDRKVQLSRTSKALTWRVRLGRIFCPDRSCIPLKYLEWIGSLILTQKLKCISCYVSFETEGYTVYGIRCCVKDIQEETQQHLSQTSEWQCATVRVQRSICELSEHVSVIVKLHSNLCVAQMYFNLCVYLCAPCPQTYRQTEWKQ